MKLSCRTRALFASAWTNKRRETVRSENDLRNFSRFRSERWYDLRSRQPLSRCFCRAEHSLQRKAWRSSSAERIRTWLHNEERRGIIQVDGCPSCRDHIQTNRYFIVLNCEKICFIVLADRNVFVRTLITDDEPGLYKGLLGVRKIIIWNMRIPYLDAPFHQIYPRIVYAARLGKHQEDDRERGAWKSKGGNR